MVDDGAAEVHVMNTNLRKFCMLETVDEVIIRTFECG